jgi:hypothetical protein
MMHYGYLSAGRMSGKLNLQTESRIYHLDSPSQTCLSIGGAIGSEWKSPDSKFLCCQDVNCGVENSFQTVNNVKYLIQGLCGSATVDSPPPLDGGTICKNRVQNAILIQKIMNC